MKAVKSTATKGRAGIIHVGEPRRPNTTVGVIVPIVVNAAMNPTCTKLPLLAAGGIGSGEAMLAAMVLGADGVQIGSAFAVSEESSAHPDFKRLVTELGEGGTKLALKKLAPVRLVKNNFFNQVDEAEKAGQSPEAMSELLGRGRAKKGMFEGQLDEGELEIGQVSAQLNQIRPVAEIMKDIIAAYEAAQKAAGQGRFEF